MTRERRATIADLDTIVVEPDAGSVEAPRFVLVLLHGFQMTPEDLVPFAHSLKLPAIAYFPRGILEARPRGRAWWFIDPDARDAAIAKGPRDFITHDPPDLFFARRALRRFLAQLSLDHPGLPIALAGFSQGGMLSTSTLLHPAEDRDDPHEPDPDWLPSLRALALLSSSRIIEADWASERTACFQGLPVFVSHGERDPDLAFSAGARLHAQIEAAGGKTTFLAFDGAHEIPLVVWRGLRKFLIGLFPAVPMGN